MLQELLELEKKLPEFLQDETQWDSLLIDKYPPIVHRLSRKISDDRTLLLHKIYETDQPYMHSHSYNLAVKCIKGSYETDIGFSQDRKIIPKPIYKHFVKEGDSYEITSSDVWHTTKTLNGLPSYSIVLIGGRQRGRLAQNIGKLEQKHINELLDFFRKHYENNSKCF